MKPVSIAAVGLPDIFFVAMTGLELLIPFFMAFMQSRISKTANAHQNTHAESPVSGEPAPAAQDRQ